MNIFANLDRMEDRKRYPNSIFFFKGGKVLMEYNGKNEGLGCRQNDFWEILGEKETDIKSQFEAQFQLRVSKIGVL